MCFRNGCDRYRKSVRRDKIEGEFEQLLERLTPTRRLHDMVHAMFKKAWGQREAQAAAMVNAYKAELLKIQKQIDALLDRVVDASSPIIVNAYEKRINALERNKLTLVETSQRKDERTGTFEELFELAMRFLSSPSKIWKFGTFEQKKVVLRLTFADRLRYCLESGFRTPKTTIPFNVLEGFRAGENVRPET
jgi:CRISPR/Cas system CSM-associated protein Csm2 small subunit